jgi:hypothetical protein
MTFFNTTIKDEEIIGISSLWRKDHPDRSNVMLYGAFDMNFVVYTKQNSIKIFSNYFTNDKANQRILTEWQLEYCNYYIDVCGLINCPVPAYIKRMEGDCINLIDKLLKEKEKPYDKTNNS